MAILAGLLLGGAILSALFIIEVARSLRQGSRAGLSAVVPQDLRATFLFKDRSLIQTNAEGEALVEQAMQRSTPDEPCDDWDLVIGTLSPRFPGLPSEPMWQTGQGQVWLDPDTPGASERLFLEWWPGHIRLTLTETEGSDVAAASQAASQAAPSGTSEEAGWLRQAVTGAPYPIWQSDGTGRVLWANVAYCDLVRRFGQNETAAGQDACRPLFAIPYNADQDSASFRMPVTPAGSTQPYWFDVRCLRLDQGWMNYATDVNAVVNAEIAQRNFVQTLTKTFAHLSIGLAIFDRKRQLALFNPALIDLTTLPAEFLSARPNLLSFFDRLRDRQMMPEPKNYTSWRDQIADLVAAADTGQYSETWSLPSGLTYRISGRPHPDGAVAFLFEDISAEISLTRRFRSQLELGQCVLNTLEQSIAVFSSSGVLAFSNKAYRQMWSIDSDCGFTDLSITDAARHWQAGSMPTPVWGDLRDFVVQFGERAEWQADVILRDGRGVQCQVIPMSGGATLVIFQTEEARVTSPQDALLPSPA